MNGNHAGTGVVSSAYNRAYNLILFIHAVSGVMVQDKERVRKEA